MTPPEEESWNLTLGFSSNSLLLIFALYPFTVINSTLSVTAKTKVTNFPYRMANSKHACYIKNEEGDCKESMDKSKTQIQQRKHKSCSSMSSIWVTRSHHLSSNRLGKLCLAVLP